MKLYLAMWIRNVKKACSQLCPLARCESFFEVKFCKPALGLLWLNFWTPSSLRMPFPPRWVPRLLWALQEMMEEGNNDSSYSHVWVIDTYNWIQNINQEFYSRHFVEEKKSLQTTWHICISLCSYLQIALQKCLCHPEPPGSCLPRNAFLFSSRMHMFFWRRKNLSLDFHCLTVPARVLFFKKSEDPIGRRTISESP